MKSHFNERNILRRGTATLLGAAILVGSYTENAVAQQEVPTPMPVTQQAKPPVVPQGPATRPIALPGLAIPKLGSTDVGLPTAAPTTSPGSQTGLPANGPVVARPSLGSTNLLILNPPSGSTSKPADKGSPAQPLIPTPAPPAAANGIAVVGTPDVINGSPGIAATTIPGMMASPQPYDIPANDTTHFNFPSHPTIHHTGTTEPSQISIGKSRDHDITPEAARRRAEPVAPALFRDPNHGFLAGYSANMLAVRDSINGKAVEDHALIVRQRFTVEPQPCQCPINDGWAGNMAISRNGKVVKTMDLYLPGDSYPTKYGAFAPWEDGTQMRYYKSTRRLEVRHPNGKDSYIEEPDGTRTPLPAGSYPYDESGNTSDEPLKDKKGYTPDKFYPTPYGHYAFFPDGSQLRFLKDSNTIEVRTPDGKGGFTRNPDGTQIPLPEGSFPFQDPN